MDEVEMNAMPRRLKEFVVHISCRAVGHTGKSEHSRFGEPPPPEKRSGSLVHRPLTANIITSVAINAAQLVRRAAHVPPDGTGNVRSALLAGAAHLSAESKLRLLQVRRRITLKRVVFSAFSNTGRRTSGPQRRKTFHHHG